MSLVDALQAAVGAANVIVDGDLSAWEVDWRKRYRGRALQWHPQAGQRAGPALRRAALFHWLKRTG